MKLKEFRLDFEAMLSKAIYGPGFVHYGYWPDGPPETLSLQGLGAAQQAWFNRLVAEIPAGIDTILDMGSGTGANALALERMGYLPGWRLALDEDMTRAILPTFRVLDHLKNAHLAPFLTRFRAEFRRARPVSGRLLDWVLGRRIDRFLRPSQREESFARKYEYRLIRLERAQ